MTDSVTILVPRGEDFSGASQPLASRVESLNGKVVALMANGWRSLDTCYDEFRNLLHERYEVSEVIEKRKLGAHPYSTEDLDDIARRADVAITGLGN